MHGLPGLMSGRKGNDAYIDWVTNPSGGFMEPYTVDLTSHPVFREISDAKKRGEDFHVFDFSGEPLAETYALLASFAPKQFEGIKASGISFPARQINHYVFGAEVGLMFITPEPHPEAHDIFKRFGKVFEQTYTRFLDLQKAEAQARESQIQLAMERVRARTMAMQRSDELADAASLLFKQLEDLGIKSWSSGFNIWQNDGRSATINMCNPDGSITTPYYLPHTEDIFFIRICEARKRGEDLLVMETGGKELEDTYNYMFGLPEVRKVLGAMEDTGFQIPKFQVNHCAFFSQGYLMFITYEPVPEMWDVFKRLAKVFEQTYTRFLDLQKAEEQARESQIQLAMERVRARTMAMQNSNELPEAANLLFRQVRSLGMPAWSAGYCIWDEDKQAVTVWVSAEDVLMPSYRAPLTEDPTLIHMKEAYDRGETFFVEEIGGEELVKHYQYMITLPILDEMLKKINEAGHPLPTFQINHLAFFSQGFLIFITYEPVPEAHDIFKRFAKVFEQTYTRFLDLQKAEAQARESQIQLAMERVRARTMAMQRSEELTDTAALLFQQVNELGIHQWGNAFQLWDDDMKGVTSWTCTHGVESLKSKIPATEDPVMINIVNAAQKGEDLYVEEMGGEALENHYKSLTSLPVLKEVFEKLAEGGFTPPKFQVFHAAYFSYGYILFITHEPYPEAHDIFKRFCKSF